MRSMVSRLLALTLLVFASGCGYRELAPPPAPALRFPDVRLPPGSPPEGKVHVVLDANGSSAIVSEVSSWRTSAAWTSEGAASLAELSTEERPVCIAPCVADLAPGMHVLRFKSTTDERSSTVAVQVNHRSKVVRHAMGQTSRTLSPVGFAGAVVATLGVTSMIVGAGLLAAEDEDTKERAAPLIAGGGATVLVSIPLFLIGRPERQQGSTTEFDF